ncbi:3-deoxy-7-phosphoheptulonate synthase [Natranaerofaba carboxydovora]|uniref:3-deoxy-7-phosphoheptulonate synthase n=1 Tax=Natranaerofaba carboxydovora TaxID=2742683 RepID=UPI001F138185|nr:3-deoxy-7-phosphoheptulonate synthase [Natranaerofaba carboxydovora]UMZ73222.1 Phospho-2-dehydro-3-deoxyheptonate aldolase [Natranaerofaba carboxydovora]
MIVVMGRESTDNNVDEVIDKLKGWGFGVNLSKGDHKTVIGVIGDRKEEVKSSLEALSYVEKVVSVSQPFKLVSRDFQPEDSVIDIGHTKIGGEELILMVGPCAVENENILIDTAKVAKETGCQFLRGGAYKPRSSPYSFQGLGEEGLKLLKKVKEEKGLSVISEVMDKEQVELVKDHVDVLQIGTRNMQNFNLLKAVGKQEKPVLLKRGMSSTIEEWLMAAEYIMAEGNFKVILCERGIRTFETATRNTLDLSAIPVVKSKSHLPVVVDPSHGVGKSDFVPQMSKAAVAAGADGLLIEVHPNPESAVSDGPQSLDFGGLRKLVKELKEIAPVVGRKL